MSIITKIDGIPLFNSKWKAIRWGKKFGLTGTHTHVHNDQIGWMAGENHGELDKAFKPRERIFIQKPKNMNLVDSREDGITQTGGGYPSSPSSPSSPGDPDGSSGEASQDDAGESKGGEGGEGGGGY